MKTFLISIVSIVGLFVAATAAIFVFQWCPPQGPWPNPPWCVIEKEIEFKDVIIVPTDINKINYPQFYQQAQPTSAALKNPYCLIEADTVAYPTLYLGEYSFPQIEGAPLPAEIKRVVGIKDAWNINDPNLNKCPYSPFISNDFIFDSYEKTLKRVKALGTEQIAVTNFILFSNFQSAELENNKPAIKAETLIRIIKTAKTQGLDVILYLNLAGGNEKVSPEIPNSEWLAKLIDNYEPFLMSQAKIAQEAGAKGLMLNHGDYQFNIKGYEEIYQQKMLALIKKVRSIYSGELILFIDALNYADHSKISEVLSSVDVYLYPISTNILKYAKNKTVSVYNLKQLYLEDLKKIEAYRKYNKPFYLQILIQSEKNFLIDGWNEDMFCIQRENDQCYQLKLKPDFSVQAIAYEATMEAIKEMHDKKLKIAAVVPYGYWFTDVILPKNSQPQMGHSIRNKPAESIVKEWFRK